MRPRLTSIDRLIFVWLYRLFPSIADALTIVQPHMVVRWHRAGFRLYWRRNSRSSGGRPRIAAELRRVHKIPPSSAKKKLGLRVTAEKMERGRIFRISDTTAKRAA